MSNSQGEMPAALVVTLKRSIRALSCAARLSNSAACSSSFVTSQLTPMRCVATPLASRSTRTCVWTNCGSRRGLAVRHRNGRMAALLADPSSAAILPFRCRTANPRREQGAYGGGSCLTIVLMNHISWIESFRRLQAEQGPKAVVGDERAADQILFPNADPGGFRSQFQPQ